MSSGNGSDFDVTRAELFEALGHPNRIRILKALAREPLGFSELKRAVEMESSGLLSFHLQKLTYLVKVTPEGTYALTDDGREALRIAETIKSHDSNAEDKRFTPRVSVGKIVIAALLIGLIVMGVVAVYQQEQIIGLNRLIAVEQVGSVLIDGNRYSYLSVPLRSLNFPATIQFDGVTFNLTAPPLGGGGTVLLTALVSNVTLASQQGQGTGIPITIRLVPLPNILVKFADGHTESHNFVNSTSSFSQGEMSINFEPVVNPWFTSHSSPRAGVYLNSTTDSLELYVSRAL
jgi:DNA-binding transcriptional ArsR family regulator